MWRERSIRGFTLVELCCVLVIAGVLAAVAGPRFLDTPAFDQRGYADELAAAIRSAEAAATASGCAVELTLAPGAGYSAELPAGAACSGAFQLAVPRADGTPLAGSPPADADVAAPMVLTFQPLTLESYGPVVTPAPGNTLTIDVDGSPSGQTQPLQIQIDTRSGFVTAP